LHHGQIVTKTANVCTLSPDTRPEGSELDEHALLSMTDCVLAGVDYVIPLRTRDGSEISITPNESTCRRAKESALLAGQSTGTSFRSPSKEKSHCTRNTRASLLSTPPSHSARSPNLSLSGVNWSPGGLMTTKPSVMKARRPSHTP
jgi:hypothetical protein